MRGLCAVAARDTYSIDAPRQECEYLLPRHLHVFLFALTPALVEQYEMIGRREVAGNARGIKYVPLVPS